MIKFFPNLTKMKNNSLEEIAEILNSAEKVAIFCHIRPDGDAIGSGLALLLALENLGKTAYMCCDEFDPTKFLFLSAVSKIKTHLPEIDFDAFVTVDCADVARLGIYQRDYVKMKGVTVNIDHHISNDGYGKYNCVTQCTATCEIVTRLFKVSDWQVTNDIANLLMLGLITDSGNFTHSDVTPETYRLAAFLREKGADCNLINYQMFTRQPKQRALLYGKVMSKMRFLLDDRFAIITISLSDLHSVGAEKSMTEGFVDFPLTVDGVQVAASVMEYREGQYKVSLRSKGKVNVNAVASTFGGGGHVLASGCMLFGSLEEVIDRLTYAVYQNI